MRVTILTASLFLTTALASTTALTLATPATARTAKVTCLCDCPDDHKIKARPAPRRAVRRAARAAPQRFYDYDNAHRVSQHGWHGEWRMARNDGYGAPMPEPAYGPAYYGPPPQEPGLRVDDRGWTGGVGGDPEGGGGGGFVDGYGQVHFGNGGSVENGPTYNSYNQSFQYNPSVAGRFQPRLMGGLAPAKK